MLLLGAHLVHLIADEVGQLLEQLLECLLDTLLEGLLVLALRQQLILVLYENLVKDYTLRSSAFKELSCYAWSPVRCRISRLILEHVAQIDSTPIDFFIANLTVQIDQVAHLVLQFLLLRLHFFYDGPLLDLINSVGTLSAEVVGLMHARCRMLVLVLFEIADPSNAVPTHRGAFGVASSIHSRCALIVRGLRLHSAPQVIGIVRG